MHTLLISFQARLQTTVRHNQASLRKILTSTDVILDISPQATQQQIRDAYKKYIIAYPCF